MNAILGASMDPVELAIVALGVPLAIFATWLWYRSERSRETAMLVGTRVAFGTSLWRTVEGEESPYYFDADSYLGDPSNVDQMAEWFSDMTRGIVERSGGIDVLAFIEKTAGPVGMITAKELLTSRTRIPSLVVRPRRRLGNGSLKGMRDLRGKTALVVSDVGTHGGTVLEAVGRLRKAGLTVKSAVVLYDRLEGAGEALAKEGVELHAMLTRSDATWLDKEEERSVDHPRPQSDPRR